MAIENSQVEVYFVSQVIVFRLFIININNTHHYIEMAFWGIGKLKQYGGMINFKDVGSKLKTYVNQPQQQQHQDSNQTPNVGRPMEELLKIQLIEYQKLVSLQKQILAQIEDQKKREYEQKQAILMKQLSQMQSMRENEKKEEAVMELSRKIETGQRDLRSIMMENTLLREQLSYNRNKHQND